MPSESTKYRGYCHCGGFRFELTVPEIKSATACDCRLCKKKGYIWTVPPKGSYKVVRDDGLLQTYESASLRHQFCGRCSTGISGEHVAGPTKGQMAINLLAVREVNPFQLEQDTTVTHVDEPEHALKPRRDPPPERRTHHLFSCHCGRVQAQLLTPVSEQQVKQDNCSSCIRKAYIGVYPNKDQVRIHGKEYTKAYMYGKKYGADHFCATCGVFVFATVIGPPLSVFDNVPPERKEFVMSVYRKNINLLPLNMRCVEGLDIASLKIDKTDYGAEDYELPDEGDVTG
ncbi:hypothetical protein MHUMG1_01845 [Metarhizium humberi]|uniref:CENP-V/GFA domain-containing protein n=1 Tax=Metarhizium humberi TaxID=2596975 RepID=A0A9P8MIJ5_9HYPO|nr:hypothetical protein MHUMG1_01845 [Metarhizium humberi]